MSISSFAQSKETKLPAQRRETSSILNSLNTYSRQAADTLSPKKIIVKSDSLLDITQKNSDKVTDSLKLLSGGSISKLTNGVDTIKQNVNSNVERVYNVLSKPIDSLQQKVKNTSDSLQNKITSGIQSITDKADSKIESATSKVESEVTETHKIETKVGAITEGANDKAKSITEKLPETDKLKLPDNDRQKSVPGTDKVTQGLDDVKVLGLKTDVPNANVPSLDTNLQKQLPDLKAPDLKVPDLKEIDKVNELSAEVDKISGQTEQVNVDNYTNELDNIKTEVPTNANALSKQVEDKAGEFTGIKNLDAEKTKLTAEQTKILDQQAKYEAMLQKYRDKKLIQEEVKRKATSIANDELAKHTANIQAGQKQLNKAKKGLSGIKSVKDIFRKRSTELDGKKFYQRIVPGLTWQIYSRDYVSVDLGLQAGYRISSKFTAGIGGVYRAGFSDEFDNYVKGLRTYGGRVYAELAIAKGVFAHGEFEMLKVDAAIQTNASEPTGNRINGSYFGLGKRFRLSRTFRGSIQGLYRVEYNGELPDVNALTARFGLEYTFRKKKKKLVTNYYIF